MKNRTISLLAFGLFSTIVRAQTFTLPDADFAAALNTNYPAVMANSTDLDISAAKVYSFGLNLRNKGISDLDGIQYFTNITQLLCDNNDLTSVDVSNNTKLTKFECVNNDITSITGLANLSLLKSFKCRLNNLTDLSDMENLTDLEVVWISNNPLTSFPDISSVTKLVEFWAGKHNTTDVSIDLSNNTALRYFEAIYSDITSLKGLGQLASLERLVVWNNRIPNLNGLEAATGLTRLDVRDNELSGLPDMSTFTNLTSCRIEGNRLDFSDYQNILAVDVLSNITQFTYADQEDFLVPQDTVVTCLNKTVTLSIEPQSGANSYQWYRYNTLLSGETNTDLSLTLDEASDFTVYICYSYGNTLEYPADISYAPGISSFRSERIHVIESDVPCSDCKNGKVEICHVPPGNPSAAKTICVDESAVTGHLGHGDHKGTCTGSEGQRAYLFAKPNPFNTKTIVNYFIPEDMDVSIRILNNKGETVDSEDFGEVDAGAHTSDFKADKPGVYTVMIILEDSSTITTRIVSVR